MPRKRRLDNIKNGFFRSVICFRYQVVDAFLVADAELAIEIMHHFFGACICGPEQGFFEHRTKVRQPGTLWK